MSNRTDPRSDPRIESGDQELRALFREAHEQLDPPAPPLAGLLRPVTGPTPRYAPGYPRWPSTAIASAVILLLVSAALWLVLKVGPSADRHDEAFRLASELGDWEAPTDFLLQTPGIEFFEEAPRFGTPLNDSSDETNRPTGKEIIQ